MRWAFWRRARGAKTAAQPVDDALTAPAVDEVPPAARDDDPDGERGSRQGAFSGAAPDPGASAGTASAGRPDLPAVQPGEGMDELDLLSQRMGRLRVAVVDLVRAALDRDATRVQRLLDQLVAHESDLELALLVAVTGLGPRLLRAADVDADTPLDADRQRAVAQGETLCGRAEPLRARVVPDCPPALLRVVMLQSLDLALDDAGGESLADDGADARQLVAAAAVLLAQGIADGDGGPAVLAEELAVLLPDG